MWTLENQKQIKKTGDFLPSTSGGRALNLYELTRRGSACLLALAVFALLTSSIARAQSTIVVQQDDNDQGQIGSRKFKSSR